MRTGPNRYGRLVLSIHTIRDPVATGRPAVGSSPFSPAIHKNWARDTLKLRQIQYGGFDGHLRHGSTVKMLFSTGRGD